MDRSINRPLSYRSRDLCLATSAGTSAPRRSADVVKTSKFLEDLEDSEGGFAIADYSTWDAASIRNSSNNGRDGAEGGSKTQSKWKREENKTKNERIEGMKEVDREGGKKEGTKRKSKREEMRVKRELLAEILSVSRISDTAAFSCLFPRGYGKSCSLLPPPPPPLTSRRVCFTYEAPFAQALTPLNYLCALRSWVNAITLRPLCNARNFVK